jgi:ParB/RepB/Spo0J family partition protein
MSESNRAHGTNGIQWLAVAAIDEAPDNFRWEMPGIQELASSLTDTGGPLQAIGVESAGERYVAIWGNRRLRAAREAGQAKILCRVFEKLTPIERMTLAITENLQREALSPMEEATAFARILEVTGWKVGQLAERVHCSPALISQRTPLVRFPKAFQERIHRGEVTASAAYEISKRPETEWPELIPDAGRGRDYIAAKVRQQSHEERNGGRFSAKLAGNSITVSGVGSVEGLIDALQALLSEARKARTKSWSLGTLSRVLKESM